MGNFFSKLKALWDQGLRGRGSKMIKVRKDDKRNLPDERRTLLNRASYLYSNDQTRKYSFENERTKTTRAMRLLERL